VIVYVGIGLVFIVLDVGLCLVLLLCIVFCGEYVDEY